MQIPANAQMILNTLWHAGFQAQVVGGCVRDALMGSLPSDWDICTSALPEETRRCFSQLPVIDTGIAHGTVTVVADREPFEVTTYRADGRYSDHRRPDEVLFVRTLDEDLKRRDFTINAMAWSEQSGLVDLFGGQADLQARLIRCVGDPEQRFREDALRILRAMRFASTLDFTIHPDTARAMETQMELLRYVASERVFSELTKLLCGVGAGRVLAEFSHVLGVVLPEILPSVGFDQHNPCHDKDVWLHTLAAVDYAPREPLYRWTLLLHDLGKPSHFSLDKAGVGHFHGHPAESARMAEGIYRRLHSDRQLRETSCQLIKYHDAPLPISRKGILRWLNRFGEDWLCIFVTIRRCDGLAHADAPKMRYYRDQLERFSDGLERLIAENACYTVTQLEVNGRDILALGISGPRVGVLLSRLLEAVIGGECANRREVLLNRLDKMIREEEST